MKDDSSLRMHCAPPDRIAITLVMTDTSDSTYWFQAITSSSFGSTELDRRHPNKTSASLFRPCSECHVNNLVCMWSIINVQT